MLLLALLGIGVATSANAAEVTGVVRDVRGVPQMGVLVEILGSGGMETALTDLHGHFLLRGIKPGDYDLRTSGAFFSPRVRRGLRVQAGQTPVLNVVLTGWFDELGSLAPHSRAVGDPVSDWKWTLRSPAARPMLRLADDDGEETRPAQVEESGSGGRHGTLRTAAGSNAFGTSTESLSLLVGAAGSGGHVEDTLEITSGGAGLDGSAAPSGVRGSYESGLGQGVRRQVTVSARTLPQIAAGSASSGFEVIRVDALQRMEVGSRAAVEVGSRAEGVRAVDTAVAVRPLLRLTVNPAGDWVVSYELLSAPGQGFDEAGGEGANIPAVAASVQGLSIVRQQEQALRVRKRSGRVQVEAALTRERAGAGVVSGAFLGGARDATGLAMVDTATGTFRRLGPGLDGLGGAMALEAPVGEATEVAARVLIGPGLGLVAADGTTRAREGTAVLLEVRRSMPRTGTEAAVSYRWQPGGMLTTVGAFDAAGVSPYLGVHVRQRLPMRCGEGGGAELTVDATNLLGEGYHDVQGPQQPETVLMSALREVRAGIEVSF